MATSSSTLLQQWLRDVRLKSMREKILSHFTFVTSPQFERRSVHGNHTEWLQVIWREANNSKFTTWCDFHLVRQLEPVDQFLKGHRVNDMLCCRAGIYDTSLFANKTQPKNDHANMAMEVVEAPQCNLPTAPVVRHIDTIPTNDALVQDCLALKPFILIEVRDYEHPLISVLYNARLVSKCAPVHYYIRKDGPRLYYVTWITKSCQANSGEQIGASSPLGVCTPQSGGFIHSQGECKFNADDVRQVTQQYNALLNVFYKHDPSVRVRPPWGRGDNVAVFWEAVAIILRLTGRLVIQ